MCPRLRARSRFRKCANTECCPWTLEAAAFPRPCAFASRLAGLGALACVGAVLVLVLVLVLCWCCSAPACVGAVLVLVLVLCCAVPANADMPTSRRHADRDAGRRDPPTGTPTRRHGAGRRHAGHAEGPPTCRHAEHAERPPSPRRNADMPANADRKEARRGSQTWKSSTGKRRQAADTPRSCQGSADGRPNLYRPTDVANGSNGW